MSDTKRILVWLFVLVWCVLSLAFDVRAQDICGEYLTSNPSVWSPRPCSELVVAANTIIIKKKAVASVPVAETEGAWYYSRDNHECVDADDPYDCCTGSGAGSCTPYTDSSFTSTDVTDNGYSNCGSVYLPAGSATKMATYVNPGGTARNYKVSLRAINGNPVYASGTGATSNASVLGWHEVSFSVPYTIIEAGNFEICIHPETSGLTFGYIADVNGSAIYISETYADFPTTTQGGMDTYNIGWRIWVQ